jgi:hypothetical protein
MMRFQPSALRSLLAAKEGFSRGLSDLGFSADIFLGSEAFAFFLKKREIMAQIPSYIAP